MKTIQACILIATLFFAFSIASVSALGSSSFGGKSGDWTEYEFQDEMQVASGLPSSEFVRIDFLSVEGANVTVNATLYTSSLQISNETKTIDLTSHNGQDDITLYPMFNARVYFIPAGLNITDPVYLGQLFGTQNITGQTTKSYVGADRTVIFTNFTLQGSNYYFYWDKQTGALTEGLKYIGAAYTDVLVTDTNLWSPPILWSLLLWVAIALAIVLGVLSSRRSLSKMVHRKGNTKPTLTKTNSFLSFKQSKGKGY
jgi:hypothetical protein